MTSCRHPAILQNKARLFVATAAAAAAASVPSLFAPRTAFAAAPQPNIVMILVDDLGYGDVGFNGQTRINTPNIDQLAANSYRYDLAYCPAAVCGPTRASLLQGLHNGHTYVDRNDNLPRSDRNDVGFRADDVMIPQVLKQQNYNTAAFGKWGFGGDEFTNNPSIVEANSLPNNHGFDEFYGYLNHKRAHDYFIPSLWETDVNAPNGIKTVATGGVYSHDLVSARAEQYIGDHAGDSDPFFALVEYTIPHFDLDDIASVPGGTAEYDSEPWTDKQKKYASMITRMDASVGQIISRLHDPNQDGNTSDSIAGDTLVVFASDNGPTAEDGAPISFFDSNGPLRGGKRDLWDGGVRTPLLFYWDGVVTSGVNTTQRVDLTDLMPTFAELAGAETPAGLDGVSLAPSLTGTGIQRNKPYIILEHHEVDGPDSDNRDARWAIIRDDYKLLKFSNGDYELYHLPTDINENNPLDLNLQVNADLKSELESIAMAEQVEQPDSYHAIYPTWNGNGDGTTFGDSSNWSAGAVPAETWLASIDNTGVSPSTIEVATSQSVLGLDVRGSGADLKVLVASGQNLTARNQLRISTGGIVNLQDGHIATVRWVDVNPGGKLMGSGTVTGDVYSLGTISPGQTTPVGNPATTPTQTGVVTAITFDFTGIQDDAPLVQTSTLSGDLQLVHGLNFGPGTQSKASESGVTSTDAGDEFNIIGFETSSLSNAIAANDYVSYTVAPIAGLGMRIDTASFNLWRNGLNAADNYAILTSAHGFATGNELGSINITSTGDTNQVNFTANDASNLLITSAVDIRLYGWGGQLSGNTHLNAVSLDASFESLPGGMLEVTDQLTIQGNLHLITGSLLALELAGDDNSDPQAQQFDTLTITGDASLAGDLVVEAINSYVPLPGETFEILTASSITGSFNQTQISNVAGLAGLWLNVLTDSDSVTLEADALGGDANLDGAINGSDLSILATNFGASGNWHQADFNGDGLINGADLSILASNFGSSVTSPSATTVPEPASAILLAGLLAGLLRRSDR